MAISSAYDCSTDPGAITRPGSNNCGKEGSLIVGVALFASSFDPTSLDDTETTWQTGVQADDIKIVPNVSGNWAEPSEVTAEGKGFQSQFTTALEFDIPFDHYTVDPNLSFWNYYMQREYEYSMGFIFEDYKMYMPLDQELNLIPVNLFTRPQSEKTLNNIRQFMINARWRSRDLPYAIEVPGNIFASDFGTV